MKATDFIHPQDASARNSLESLPGLKTLTEKVFDLGYDELLWSERVTTCLRLGPTQMPEIYNLLPPICDKLGIKQPELYLEMTTTPNSWTSGHKRTYIVVTYGLIRRCTLEEISAILAHECGHILCEHIIYSTLADVLCSLGDNLAESKLGKIVNMVAIEGIRQALCAWSRAAELSADRVACFVSSSDALIRGLAKCERIPIPIIRNMDFNAWAQQGADYEALKQQGIWSNIVRFKANSDLTHPYTPVRAYEMKEWERSRQYNILETGKRCPNCGVTVPSDWKFCKKCGSKV